MTDISMHVTLIGKIAEYAGESHRNIKWIYTAFFLILEKRIRIGAYRSFDDERHSFLSQHSAK